MRRTLPVRPFSISILALCLAACTRDAPQAPAVEPGPDPVPASIEIAGAAQAQIGAAVHLVAVVRDADGDTLWEEPVTWTSSDTARVALAPNIVQALPGGAPRPGALVTPKRIAVSRIIASTGTLHDTVIFEGVLAPFIFVFPDTLSEGARRLLFDAVQDAHAFQLSTFGRAVEDSTTVTGAASGHPACSAGGAAAATSLRAVVFCLDNPGWAMQGPVMKQKIVQHEVFHAWQFEHGWIRNPATAGATWLIEGAAELVGFRGIAARGLLPVETALGCQVKESADFATRAPPGLPSLSSVETRAAFQSAVGPLYTHSMLAANLLAGTDLPRLRAYGDSIAAGTEWRTAFQQAFGEAPAAFYARYPGQLSGLSVPSAYACRL